MARCCAQPATGETTCCCGCGLSRPCNNPGIYLAPLNSDEIRYTPDDRGSRCPALESAPDWGRHRCQSGGRHRCCLGNGDEKGCTICIAEPRQGCHPGRGCGHHHHAHHHHAHHDGGRDVNPFAPRPRRGPACCQNAAANNTPDGGIEVTGTGDNCCLAIHQHQHHCHQPNIYPDHGEDQVQACGCAACRGDTCQPTTAQETPPQQDHHHHFHWQPLSAPSPQTFPDNYSHHHYHHYQDHPPPRRPRLSTRPSERTRNDTIWARAPCGTMYMISRSELTSLLPRTRGEVGTLTPFEVQRCLPVVLGPAAAAVKSTRRRRALRVAGVRCAVVDDEDDDSTIHSDDEEEDDGIDEALGSPLRVVKRPRGRGLQKRRVSSSGDKTPWHWGRFPMTSSSPHTPRRPGHDCRDGDCDRLCGKVAASPKAVPYYNKAINLILSHLEERTRTGAPTDMFDRANWHTAVEGFPLAMTEARTRTRPSSDPPGIRTTVCETRTTEPDILASRPPASTPPRHLVVIWYRIMACMCVVLNGYSGLGCSDELLRSVSRFLARFLPRAGEIMGDARAARLLSQYALVYRRGDDVVEACLERMWRGLTPAAQTALIAMVRRGRIDGVREGGPTGGEVGLSVHLAYRDGLKAVHDTIREQRRRSRYVQSWLVAATASIVEEEVHQ